MSCASRSMPHNNYVRSRSLENYPLVNPSSRDRRSPSLASLSATCKFAKECLVSQMESMRSVHESRLLELDRVCKKLIGADLKKMRMARDQFASPQTSFVPLPHGTCKRCERECPCHCLFVYNCEDEVIAREDGDARKAAARKFASELPYVPNSGDPLCAHCWRDIYELLHAPLRVWTRGL